MCNNICGMVANIVRVAMLRRSVRDAHIVAVCVVGMRATFPAKKEYASDVAHNVGFRYYEIFFDELNNTRTSIG